MLRSSLREAAPGTSPNHRATARPDARGRHVLPYPRVADSLPEARGPKCVRVTRFEPDVCTHSHDTLTPPNYQFLRLLAAFKKIVKASHTILTPNTRNEGLIDVPFSTPRVQDHRCTRTLTTSTVPTASMPRPVCPPMVKSRANAGAAGRDRHPRRLQTSTPPAVIHAACLSYV